MILVGQMLFGINSHVVMYMIGWELQHALCVSRHVIISPSIQGFFNEIVERQSSQKNKKRPTKTGNLTARSLYGT